MVLLCTAGWCKLGVVCGGVWFSFFFQAEDGIRDLVRSRGLGDVYKRQGHTGAVVAAGRRLAAEGRAGMLTVPGDIPLITADELSLIHISEPTRP